MPDRLAQCDRILEFFNRRQNVWIPLPEILDLRIANYRARFSELRERGYQIDNEKRRADDGILHSWYRLVAVRTAVQERLFEQKPIDSYLAME